MLTPSQIELTESLHQCRECGAYWRLWHGDGWSLADGNQKPGKCCDSSDDFLTKLVPSVALSIEETQKLLGAEPPIRVGSVDEAEDSFRLRHSGQRYRKKPVIVAAFQMTYIRRWDNRDWPNWLNKAWNNPVGEGAVWIDPDDRIGTRLCIGTKEGVVGVTPDDWIIRGVKGELYPCKPDSFEMTYELIGEERHD